VGACGSDSREDSGVGRGWRVISELATQPTVRLSADVANSSDVASLR